MGDTEKIERIKEILQNEDSAASFEAISSALSISDEEDRDLYLLDTIRWLIGNNLWQSAYGAAQLMSDGYEKSEALRTVADYLASVGHLEKAFSVFAEAEKQAVVENLSEWQQAELLHTLAKSLRRIKADFRADEVWAKAVVIAQKGELSNNLQDSADCSSVLAEIAENFAAEERIEKASVIAQNIKSIGQKERVLHRISEYSRRIKQVA